MTLYGAELKIDGSFGVCAELYFRFANALEKSPWTINLSKLDRGGIGSAYGCATIGYQFDVIGGMKTNAWPNREHALYLHALLRSLLEEDYVAAILKAEGVEVVTLAVNEEVARILSAVPLFLRVLDVHDLEAKRLEYAVTGLACFLKNQSADQPSVGVLVNTPGKLGRVIVTVLGLGDRRRSEDATNEKSE